MYIKLETGDVFTGFQEELTEVRVVHGLAGRQSGLVVIT